ncbi:MAG: hypothetical protein ACI9G1_005717 [Pirellulaceae bacterium]|jgi:hypothetical protein
MRNCGPFRTLIEEVIGVVRRVAISGFISNPARELSRQLWRLGAPIQNGKKSEV